MRPERGLGARWGEVPKRWRAWGRFALASWCFALAFAIVGFVGIVGAYACGVRANVTRSMDVGLYRETSEAVAVGSIVSGCLPEVVERRGLARGYLERGWCPGGAVPVLKRVIALAPSSVKVTPVGIFVDGVSKGGVPLRHDHLGRAMMAVPSVRVAGDAAFLLGDSQDSWDSRYYGPVSVTGWHVMRVLVAW